MPQASRKPAPRRRAPPVVHPSISESRNYVSESRNYNGFQENALLRRYASSRSSSLRDEIIERSMPLARSLAMRYRGGSESIDDLVQVASLGLVKAVDRFDPDRGKPFTAFAVPTILGELRRHFRDHVWNLRLPRGLQEMTMRVDAAVDAVTDQLGRLPTPSEIAAHLDVPIELVLESIAAKQARRTLSLDTPPTTDGETAPPVEMISRLEHGYDRVEAQLASADADLDERECRVLRLRFVDGLTQQEIGRLLGVSQMQVSRINRRALWKLLLAVRGEEAVVEPPAR